MVDKKKKRDFFICVFFCVWLISFILTENRLNSNVEINIYCENSADMDIIFYADNCTGNDFPWGEGGFCQAQQVISDGEIKKVQFKVPSGSENKLLIEFKTYQQTDIAVSLIEIKYNGYSKKIRAENIEEFFDNTFGIYECYQVGDNQVLWEDIEGTFSIFGMQLDEIPLEKTINVWQYILCTAIAFGVIVLLKFYGYIVKKRCLDLKTEVSMAIFVAILLTSAMLTFEHISFESFSNDSNTFFIKVFVGNILFILWMILLIKNLFNLRIGIICTTILIVFLELVNYFVVVLRGENFVPWDIVMAKEATAVVKTLELPWSEKMLIFLGVCILLCPVIVGTCKKSCKIPIKMRIIIVGGLLLFGSAGIEYGLKFKNIYGIQQYAITTSYNNSGVLLSFVYFTQNAGASEPHEYSKKNMEEIVSGINSLEKNADEVKPDIIMIMSESFWNPEIFENITYEETFMESYKEIENDGITANILSPQFGGGTCNVEFEALTGFSMDYIQKGLMPYEGIIKTDFWSIARWLSAEGYETIAMHPNSPDYYNRKKVYENMGFERTIFIDEFEQDIVRGWVVSDYALMNKIKEVYSNAIDSEGASQFIFAVTIQNHQPYSEDSYTKEEEVSLSANGLEDNLVAQLTDFCTGVDNSSKALGNLVEYLKTCERPVILIYWGDHMTNIGDEQYEIFYKTEYMDENDNSDYLMYLTPMVVWDNYAGKNGKLGVLSTYQILPTIFDMYNLDMPDYFSFLLQLQEQSRGRTHNKVVLDKNGIVCEELTEAQEKAYGIMELIEYDYIYGERYAKQLFE